MTTDELRAAAVDHASKLLCQIGEASAVPYTVQRDLVAGALVNFYCRGADRRADDGDAVTGEWLRAAGFEIDRTDYRLGNIGAFRPAPEIGFPDWTFVVGGVPTKQPTRGHVRRLCTALGIPLTEGVPGA